MNNVKVRFAPSPTGWMHIGNTRTALFNYLWTQKMGGKLLLRIDDTDKLRSKKEYEEGIRDALTWLGIRWDEEARQSARFSRYDEVVGKLKQAGRIYACYDTPEELEFKRKRLLAKGLPKEQRGFFPRNVKAGSLITVLNLKAVKLSGMTLCAEFAGMMQTN